MKSFTRILVVGMVTTAALLAQKPSGDDDEDGDGGDDDNGQQRQQSAPPRRIRTPNWSGDETEATNLFAVTDFQVVASNQTVVFTVAWNESYLAAMDSRYADIFFSTNLLSPAWMLIGDRYLPWGTNRLDFTLGPWLDDWSYQAAFTNSFITAGFFTLGLDFDSDDDGLTDAYERFVTGTSPLLADTDGDGVDDADELYTGFDPLVADANLDSDNDGLTDYEEVVYYCTDPLNPDTDGDGVTDFEEVFIYYTSPANGDTDSDGLSDGDEIAHGTSPFDADSDDDGLPDGWEVANGFDPLSATGGDGASGDPDHDGLSNSEEYIHGSPPRAADFDGDGLSDLSEIGGIVANSPLPWLDTSGGTDITSLFSDPDASCVDWALSSSVIVSGKAYDSLRIDLNGTVYLNEHGFTNQQYSANSSFNLMNRRGIDGAILFAPFCTDLKIATASPATVIKVADVMYDGVPYCVVEYTDIHHYFSSSANPRIVSFQFVIPYGSTTSAFVRFGSVTDDSFNYMNGRLSVIGFVRSDERHGHSYCNCEAGKVYAGLGLTFVLGHGTDPWQADSDQDGIPDPQEIALGLNPVQPDTDGDGLHDGWELAHGFDPRVNNNTDSDPANDADADPDGDGLSNRDECDWGTNPHAVDSDGDGVGDGAEAANGSDPADATDGGVPFSRIPVAFTFGDDSGSHSEKYRLEIVPQIPSGGVPSGGLPRTVSWVNAEYGECETKTAMLAPGFAYKVRLYHASTNRNGDPVPDYDYHLAVNPPSCVGVLVDDPDGLFGTDYTSYMFAAQDKEATVVVLDGILAADFDRDGVIDESDAQVVRQGQRPFRHWINDDADFGDESDDDSDIPLEGTDGNCADGVVNGRCDLLDFAPVRLDIGRLLAQLDGRGDDISLWLKQANNAVNVVWTSLGENEARNFLTNAVSNCGVGLSSPVQTAAVTPVTAQGVEVPQAVLDMIRADSDKGIILVEGKAATDVPLVLEGRRGGQPVFSMALQMRISPVKEMFRWVNLRSALNGSVSQATADGVPSNLPDAETTDCNVFFLHGFLVREDGARGWCAEMFKRLWQAGSRARFWGVTWRSDEGMLAAFNYHGNVNNAFRTAPYLAAYINSHGVGSKIVMAHSLGNMVVSSAIQDHALAVNKYFMCNAAVPSEAFDPSMHDASSANNLVHEDWKSYVSRCWTSEWHLLFPTNDSRSQLTWKNRFKDVPQVAYNFYSSGDEVLEIYSEGMPGPTEGGSITDWNGKGRYAWHKQECFKGRSWETLFAFAATDWSGWSFETDFVDNSGSGTTHPVRRYTAAQAAAIPLADLTSNTVFRLYPQSMNSPFIIRAVLDEHLAKGIPALSPPIGVTNANDKFKERDGRKTDMESLWDHKIEFPKTTEISDRWRHSNMTKCAYFYTYKLFLEFIKKGGLR